VCMDVSPPERLGLLIVRAWFEGPDQRLVARITTTTDVMSRLTTVSVVGTAADIHTAVQSWLEDLRSRDAN
jgi:hypothetical protein